jgi:tetratricopeptide (TPR) repeat protein
MARSLLELPTAIANAMSDRFDWILASLAGQTLDEDYDEEVVRRPLWKTILYSPVLVPYRILQLSVALLWFPFVAMQFEPQRRNMFLRGVPALVGVLACIVIALISFFSQDSITRRYVQLMQQAMKDKDFKLASTLGGRLVADSSESKPEITYQYAMALAQSGESEKAKSLIQTLAPDDSVGFPPAHQLRAVQLAQSLNQLQDKKSLEAFRWHLTNSGNATSEQMLLLWTIYHQRLGQFSEAIEKLEQAAQSNPGHWISIADLQKQSGDEVSAKRTLNNAKEILTKRTEKEPLEAGPRLQLAIVQGKLGMLDEAERTLLQGVSISRDPVILRAAAEFYILKFDLAFQEKSPDLLACFQNLESSLRFDPSFAPIYDRLIQLYGSGDATRNASIVKLLEDFIVSGKNAAIAHFALSSIKIMEGDSEAAKVHLEQSFQLSPTMPAVCNNLAWMLANTSPPKLDEALTLAQKAVAAVPDAGSFRDTLGTILLFQEKHSEAITHLEIALSRGVTDKKLHGKLAQAYLALGNREIAQLHAAKSQ